MADGNEAILTAINGVHTKIDDNSTKTQGRIDNLTTEVGKVQIHMGEMKVTMKNTKKDVNGHLEDHKQENIELAKERRQAGWTLLEKVFGAVLTLCVLFLVFRMGWG